MKNKGTRSLFIVLSITFVLVLLGANLCLGNLNQDEGWYLVAARACHDGLLPYRDFFFTQAPLMPLVYGKLEAIWEPAGLPGARLFTSLLGLAAAFFTALTAARVAPSGKRFASGATAFLLLAGNVYHSYFTVIPKTYALASLFLAAGFCAIAYADCEKARLRNPFAAALGGFLLAAAASTRLSLGLALAVAGFYLLARSRSLKNIWFYYGIGGLLGLGLFLVPFACSDFEAFQFANFFHGEREAGGLVFAAGSLSRLIRNYMPMFLLLVFSIALWLLASPSARRFPGKDRPGRWNLGLWLLSFVAVFLLQLFSPFPYDDYQVPLMPLAAALVSVLFWQVLPEPDESRGNRPQDILLFLLLFCSATFAFTSPLNESWMMVRKDRFWVIPKEQTDLRMLHQAALLVNEELDSGTGRLLTTDPYLAIESHRDVYPGFEMGPFGFFPALKSEQAQRFHVYNQALLTDLLKDEEQAPDLVAFSGYGFAVAAPAMTRIPDEDRNQLLQLLRERYEQIRVIPDFGQEHTPLELWRRKQ